jgi:hypothetical protein
MYLIPFLLSISSMENVSFKSIYEIEVYSESIESEIMNDCIQYSYLW